jgi:arginine N-succinyltransferase
VFLIRQSKPEDVSTLVKLARTVYFINLPPNEQIILNKIDHSVRCFKAVSGGPKAKSKGQAKAPAKSSGSREGLAASERDSDMFMFSILEPEGGVIGTSQVRAHMGGPGNPNWRMAISEKKFYSKALRFGTTHTVGRLDGDPSGPSEVGGLVLDPGFRGHSKRPGRLISYVRFHLMGLYRASFADTVLAEMMGVVTGEGDSPFWDQFGRKFIPHKYADADRFCQYDRSFITDLLPKEEIYLTLLPMEVVKLVGEVSEETKPARKILENLGFQYRGYVDPFDGGPHLDCPTDQVPLVKWTRRAVVGKPTTLVRCNEQAIISVMNTEGEFRATEVQVEAGETGPVRLLPEAMELLQVSAGDALGFTPLKHFAGKATQADTKAENAGAKVSAKSTKARGASAKANGAKSRRTSRV